MREIVRKETRERVKGEGRRRAGENDGLNESGWGDGGGYLS